MMSHLTLIFFFILQGDWSEHELLHVWWCTTGFLSFLPIHAAGIYRENAFPGSKLLDFVVSSYTPTLSGLINASCPTTLPNSQVLAVTLPVESGCPSLYCHCFGPWLTFVMPNFTCLQLTYLL